MSRRLMRTAGLLSLGVATLFGSTHAVATAGPAAAVSNTVLADAVAVGDTNVGAAYSADVAVEFVRPLSSTERASVQRAIAEGLATPSAAPSNAIIHCDKSYRFADSNGAFTIQRKCSGTTSPWGFVIAPYWCGVAVSSVAEHGMAWTRNGVNQPRQSPHTVGCTYTFHGTFNPARANDKVTYVDLYDFAVEIDGVPGQARLTIRGSYSYASSPCSPTSC